MIHITKGQKEVADFIAGHPDCRFRDIRLGVPHIQATNLGTRLSELSRLKVVQRVGSRNNYRYILSGLPYTDEQAPAAKTEAIPDPFLSHIASVTLTPEQVQLFKANKSLPRSKLAKLLGMSKVELNAALEKLK